MKEVARRAADDAAFGETIAFSDAFLRFPDDLVPHLFHHQARGALVEAGGR